MQNVFKIIFLVSVLVGNYMISVSIDASGQIGNLTEDTASSGGNITGGDFFCPAGEHRDASDICVSDMTNASITCPQNQHATVDGICVSDKTNRQISCVVGQRVTINGTCIPLHDAEPALSGHLDKNLTSAAVGNR